MERRNRSLEALKLLIYIDSLDKEQRAKRLANWIDTYLGNSSIEEFDLELKDLKHLSELFYKNLTFLKKHTKDIKTQLDSNKKIKEFFK